MTRIVLCSEPLRTEWLDAYGHLAGAYYGAAFESAGWRFAEHFGMGADYTERTGHALYMVESHIRYLKEVRAPATLDFEGLVLGSDAKRNWLAIVMLQPGVEHAIQEYMEVHVDTRAGRSSAKPEEAQAEMARLRVDPLPDWAGRGMSLAKR